MAINKIEIQDSNGNIYHPHTDSTVVKHGDSTVDVKLDEINEKVNEAFQSASNGKAVIKNAITGVDPEVTIPADATFQQLADAIEQIETGYDTSDSTAGVGDILAPKTAYIPTGKVTGTMPNLGPSSTETVNLTSQNQEYVITKGYHSGLRKIKAVISGLVASVIKAGTTVGGIVGTFTADATAVVEHVLAGEKFYKNGSALVGTLARKNTDGNGYNNMNSKIGNVFSGGGVLYFPILPGAYIDNATQSGMERDTPMGYISDDDFIPEKILSNANIFGLQGGIPIVYSDISGQYPADAVLVGPNSGDGLNYAYMHAPLNGKYNQNASYLRHYEPDLLKQNIIPGKTIFGVTGNAPVKKTASGSFNYLSTASGTFEYAGSTAVDSVAMVGIGGLDFTPSAIVILGGGGTSEWPDSITVYDTHGRYYPKTFKVTSFTQTTNTRTCINYKADKQSAYVVYGGFRAPLYYITDPNYTYLWYAFE